MCSSAYAMIMHSLEDLAETVLREKYIFSSPYSKVSNRLP